MRAHAAAQVLWPWSGHLALYIRVLPEGEQYTGQATGEVTFSIISPGLRGESGARRSHVRLPIRLDILPTPPRYPFHSACLRDHSSCLEQLQPHNHILSPNRLGQGSCWLRQSIRGQGVVMRLQLLRLDHAQAGA